MEESSTQHGSSATSSGVADVAGVPADSSSTVRRGVPWALATSASSPETVRCSSFSSARIASSSSIWRRELVALGLELDAGEPGQPAQLELEDVLGLGLGEVEDRDEPGARDGRVVGGADQLDDLVDVEDRDEQALDEVQPVLALAEPVLGAAAHDPDPEADVGAQQLLEAERARLAVDEGDVVDAEGVLHRRQLVELLEHGVGVEAVLDLEDEPQAVLAVGEVLDVGDALELLGLHEGLDPLDDLLRARRGRAAR